MKILALSDIVEPALYRDFRPERFAGTDLVLSCGDLPPEYLSVVASRLSVPLYYVRGNHDIRYDTKPPGGCTDLDGRLIRYRGLRILGLGGSRWYNGNPNQYTEAQMRHRIRRLWPKLWWQRGADIVITHAPPRHIHDAEDLCHRGFRSFRSLIDRFGPRYFIHGHIHMNFSHPSQRITTVGQTRVINACGYYLFETEEENEVSQ